MSLSALAKRPALNGIAFGVPAAAGAAGTVARQGCGCCGTPTGGFAWADGDACIRQELLLLLLTVPGERVIRPAFGCHLDRLLFQPNDETLAGLAIHYVQQAIARFEPRIVVLGLDAGPAGAHQTVLEITLQYRIRRSGRDDDLTLWLDLDGSGMP